MRDHQLMMREQRAVQEVIRSAGRHSAGKMNAGAGHPFTTRISITTLASPVSVVTRRQALAAIRSASFACGPWRQSRVLFTRAGQAVRRYGRTFYGSRNCR